MPGQDLAFEEVALFQIKIDNDVVREQVVWVFRRASPAIRGLTYVVEPHGDLELAQLWQKHSARYAEAISQAWEAGDEDRLDTIAEEIEDAIEIEIAGQDEEGRTISDNSEAEPPSHHRPSADSDSGS